MGYKKWQQACVMIGRIHVKFVLSGHQLEILGYVRVAAYIRYPRGTIGDAMTATPSMMIHERIQTSQKRFHIAGHSLKKCESWETNLAPSLCGGNWQTHLDFFDGRRPLHIVSHQMCHSESVSGERRLRAQTTEPYVQGVGEMP